MMNWFKKKKEEEDLELLTFEYLKAKGYIKIDTYTYASEGKVSTIFDLGKIINDEEDIHLHVSDEFIEKLKQKNKEDQDMNDTIKTLKNLLLNSDSTSKDFYIDIDKIDYDTVFDAMINKTEFYDKYDKKYIITEITVTDEGIHKGTQLYVKFDNVYNMTIDDKMQRSICEIAEQIFAAKVDLDLNEEDTIALWDKCIKKAITIYFNYSLVKDNWNEFFRKEAEKIKKEDTEDNNEG